MSCLTIAPGVANVGVLNPSMRVFDIIMRTEYGTSYNTYLVRGSQKTALVETVHRDYLDALLQNIRDIDPDLTIDYLIMNHNEPDHSGSIEELLKHFPNMQLVTSKVASTYLKNIINHDQYELQTVTTGDTLDLGGKTLEFISAPFLHWPDSIFTYLKEDCVLFSCDFLGTHFCEPQGYDKSIHPHYQKHYEEAFAGYYQAIFLPFAEHVRNGLDKMKPLDIQLLAPSHGPMLTKEGFLGEAIARYEAWSKPIQHESKQIPIFYCSAYGNTKLLAEQIQQGIQSVLSTATISLYNVIDHDIEELATIMNESDAFLLGSPTINRDALPPMNILLAHAEAITIAKRPVALFGSYGWSGEACGHLRGRLTALKAKVYDDDFRIQFIPSEQEVKRAFEHGETLGNWLASLLS